MALSQIIRDYTDRLKREGLLRSRQVLELERSSLIHFDSNDYLSLTRDQRIAKAYQHGYALFPSGSGASMLLSGYHPNHRAVEDAFAKLLSVDDCILFSSGYAANLAVTLLLSRLKIHCFIDKGIHASIYDGLALSQASYIRYLHNNLDDLIRKLTAHPENAAVITEGIFSMSGQVAPLAGFSSLCQLHQSALLVDEAHSFGVLGKQGKGAVAYHDLSQDEVPLRIIPLGKAFAAQGALVAGKAEWINALLQAGRSIIYSTAVSPALSYGLLSTLECVVEAEDRRLKLSQLINEFRTLVASSHLNWANSITPIQQLQLGCPHLALYYAQELKKSGMSCCAIRKPTVSTKASGLRIILNYNHTPEQIHDLFRKIDSIYENKPH
ncbi:MAG: aminotransferase class I/II-fold pyridoxal phosphate-dependent enzyme [Legionella sp.]